MMRVLVLGLVALSLSDAFMLRCSRQGAGCHVAVSCVFMQDDGQPPDQKAAELAKEIPFAAYKPNKMKFKGTEVGNVPMGGALGERLSGPAKFMPYAALLTALALLTGGLTEDLVGELFRPVRDAGGYGNLLQMPEAPDMDKARALKAKQLEKRQELMDSMKRGAGDMAPPAATEE